MIMSLCRKPVDHPHRTKPDVNPPTSPSPGLGG
jgi:hypothetical protein